MKKCDILMGGSKHTLTRPTYFLGVRTPTQDLRTPWSSYHNLMQHCASHCPCLPLLRQKPSATNLITTVRAGDSCQVFNVCKL